MNHYVYRTKRGLARTVTAADPYVAWVAASKKHRLDALWSLGGEAWMESSRGGAIRERAADVGPGHALALLCAAVATEVPVAAEEMAKLARGKRINAPALRRILAARGLITLDGADCALTDLGRAFVARTEGGA